MTTVLVTTANGETGRPMVDYLLKEGLRVRAMVRTDDERAQHLRDKGVEVVPGGMLDFHDVRAAMSGAQRAYFNYPVGEGLVEAAVMFAQAARERDLELVVNMSHIQSRPDAPQGDTEPLAVRAGLHLVRSSRHAPTDLIFHAVAALHLRADPLRPLRHALRRRQPLRTDRRK